MDLSEKQLAANRANAAKSTGPKTPQGKRNSSRNSNRHRFLANAVVLDSESRDRFADLLNRLNSDFNPQDNTERVLVEKMAVCHWRLFRVWAVEAVGIAHETRRLADATLSEDAPTRVMLALRNLSDSDRHPDTFGRLERRYDREYYNAMEALKKHRREKNGGRSHQPDENKEPASTLEPISNPLQPATEPVEPAPATDEPMVSVE